MFKEKLKSLRKEHHLTQAELANQLYVSRSLVARWEYGDIFPTMENLKNISDYFGIPLDDLLCEKEKTELILHQANSQQKIKKGLRVFLLATMIIYSILSLLLYSFKILSVTGYDFSNEMGKLKNFHYSVMDYINPNNTWLIIVSIITNLVLILFSLLAFLIKKNKMKIIFHCSTGVFTAISLVFVSLTFQASSFIPADRLYFSILPTESHAHKLYESNKEEFLIFDNNSSLLEYLEGGDYIIGEDFYKQYPNILDDSFYEEYYITMLNIVLGTSDELIVEQKNSNMIYHKIQPQIATDGLMLITIFHQVQKMNFNIKSFDYTIQRH